MKNIITTLLSIAVLTTSVSASFADQNRHRNDNYKDREIQRLEDKNKDEKKKRERDAIAAGVIGLAAGALLGGSISNNNNTPQTQYYPPQNNYNNQYRPNYDRYDRRDRYDRDRPRYHENRRYNPKRWGEPYSPEWYRYCATEYRGFDPRSGTYRTRNGSIKFCEIPRHIRDGRR